MSDIVLNKAGNANTNLDSEYADVAAGGAYDGAVHADGSGASADGSLGGDATYSTHLPELPDAPEVPDAAADAQATVDAAAEDVSAHADGAVSAAGGLPDLPDVPDAPEPSGSVGVEAAFDAMVDAMGELAAHVAGSLSAMLGL